MEAESIRNGFIRKETKIRVFFFWFSGHVALGYNFFMQVNEVAIESLIFCVFIFALYILSF